MRILQAATIPLAALVCAASFWAAGPGGLVLALVSVAGLVDWASRCNGGK